MRVDRRKYQIVVTVEDETYPIDDLRDWIESEGLIIESMYEL
jgi:hypothetical protein